MSWKAAQYCNKKEEDKEEDNDDNCTRMVDTDDTTDMVMEHNDDDDDDDDDDTIRVVLLCRVAVGQWCEGNGSQITPLEIYPGTNEYYNTTVDNVNNPTMFVTYHDAQAYPEYIITIRRTK